MRRKGCLVGWLVGVVAILVVFLITVITIEALLGQRVSFPTYGARVGLIRVEGVIADARFLIEDLDAIEQDSGIKAVVVRVDSPGGGAAASQEIYERIVRLKETGRPVVVSMGAVAASGGYYIACPADSILANPGTLTGSVGVVMSFASMEELFRKVGLSFNVVKSGEFKDTGSWSREMTDRERSLLQETIDDIHAQFLETIAADRSLTDESLSLFADGRILSGRQAVEVGLVDALGDLDDAIRVAGRMAGIEGEPRVQEIVRPRRLTLRDLMAGALRGAFEPPASSFGAQYLYKPSK